MRIKSYFTDSVQDAIEHARVELGPDAMLMNSKKTEPELRALGAYEVVFGVTSDVASASSTVLPRKAPADSGGILPERKWVVPHLAGGTNKGLAALLAATHPESPQPQDAAIVRAGSSGDSVRHLPGAPSRVSPIETLSEALRVESGRAELAKVESGEENAARVEPVRVSPVTSSSASTGHSSDLSRELAELREQIEAVKRSMLQVANGTLSSPGIPDENEGRNAHDPAGPEMIAPPLSLSDTEKTSQQLMAAGFSGELAEEIGKAVEERLSTERKRGAELPSLEAVLYSELSRRLRVAPGLFVPDAARTAAPLGAGRSILFAGPAGSGKTTALLKLALRHSVTGRTPLQILSLDTLRVGGWEQLAAYARIAGLPFSVIHSPAGLGQALAEHRGKKLVLIDTPGLSPAEWRETPELAAWITREIARDAAFEVQLVLPAILRPAVAQRALEQFRALQPAKLLVTHLDEADAPGVALELALRSGLPLSYLSNGQQIPEDLEEASSERLLAPFATPAVFASSVATAA